MGKDKQFTKKQLNKRRLVQEAERRQEQRQLRRDYKRNARIDANIEEMMRGIGDGSNG